MVLGERTAKVLGIVKVLSWDVRKERLYVMVRVWIPRKNLHIVVRVAKSVKQQRLVVRDSVCLGCLLPLRVWLAQKALV